MASPWKFIARLVSPRRQQTQDDGAIEVTPDVNTTAGQANTPREESVESVGQPTRASPTPAVQSEPVSAVPEPLTQPGGDNHGPADSNSDDSAEVSEPALHDIGATPAYAVPIVKPSANARPGRGRGKQTAPVAVLSQTATVVPTASGEISLDHEIRMLRSQLTSKLRLQNAQLKKMLDRFER